MLIVVDYGGGGVVVAQGQKVAQLFGACSNLNHRAANILRETQSIIAPSYIATVAQVLLLLVGLAIITTNPAAVVAIVIDTVVPVVSGHGVLA